MSRIAQRRVLDEPARRRLSDAAARLFSHHPAIVAAYLYGSAARHEPARDLDVAVLVDGPMEPQRFEMLAAVLEREGAPFGPDVDLRPLTGAAPRFQIAVLREGELLYERDRRTRLQHEAAIMSRWADFRPTWDAMRRRMLERWSRG